MADYGVVVLASLASGSDVMKNASALSLQTGLPEPTVAKVLKFLAKGQIVRSARGVNGGYSLTRPAQEISIAQILAAIDGSISMTACVEGSKDQCDYQCHCLMKGRWNSVNSAVYSTLQGVSLADMMSPLQKQAQTQERKIA